MEKLGDRATIPFRLKRNLLRLCLLAALGGTTACAGLDRPMPKIEYYTLEYDPPRFDGLAPIPAVIELEPLNARAQYSSNRIIYRDGPFRRDAYVYARWRDDPGDLVGYFLGRDLKASRLFEAILTEPTGVAAPYRIKGTVDDFFEWDGKDSRFAVFAVNVTLVGRSRGGGEDLLLQKTYRYEQKLTGKAPQGVAEAMSKAMSTASESMIRDIYDRLSKGDLESKQNH